MAWRSRDGGGITRQVAVIVVGSLFLAHVLTLALWIGIVPTPPPIQSVASRITLTARILAAIPPASRQAVIEATSGSGVTVRAAQADLPRASGLEAGLLRNALHRMAGQGAPQARIVADPNSPELTAAIVLPDGAKLLLSAARDWTGPRDMLWFPPLVDLVFGALPLALLSIWAAWRVTGPLVRLAAAAEHVGTIDEPLPLPAEGTREIRQVARALNGLIEKLRRFVADRTRMLAAISHDLRTPLTRLRLRAEAVADPVLREKMLQDIQRMDAMISSTLAFIREDAQQEPVEPVDIAALLLTICDGFADGGAEVFYAGPLHAAGACRPRALERALNNLIDNALKFGGRATVTLHPAAGPVAGGVVIDVEDDGPGIPAAHRDDAFKPFTRGDAARGFPGNDGGSGVGNGVGLGLAIARAIVQSHGGSIELCDRVPHGLRARVHLPGPLTARPVVAPPSAPVPLATEA